MRFELIVHRHVNIISGENFQSYPHWLIKNHLFSSRCSLSSHLQSTLGEPSSPRLLISYYILDKKVHRRPPYLPPDMPPSVLHSRLYTPSGHVRNSPVFFWEIKVADPSTALRTLCKNLPNHSHFQSLCRIKIANKQSTLLVFGSVEELSRKVGSSSPSPACIGGFWMDQLVALGGKESANLLSRFQKLQATIIVWLFLSESLVKETVHVFTLR
jgi:hypothetical protein